MSDCPLPSAGGYAHCSNWSDKCEFVCVQLVVYDKIGLRWRGHYMLSVSNQMSVVQIATMFCYGLTFSPRTRQALLQGVVFNNNGVFRDARSQKRHGQMPPNFLISLSTP